MSENKIPNEGIIGMVRFSYLNVFTTRLNENKQPAVYEYSVLLMIPKKPNEFNPNPVETVKKLNALIKAGLDSKFKNGTPAVWTNPLKDGDKDLNKDTGEPRNPGYWTISATAGEAFKPLLIDGARNPVTSGWQSGDWGMVKVRMFGYDAKGNKGVSCGLKAIQFLRHDEPIGGGITTPDEFDELNGDAPLTGAPAQSDDEYDPFAE